jgi:DNA gyrase subunit B
MTDADVDGAHIRTLILTFFFRHLPDIIAKGHVYIAQPPLYKVSLGKKAHYAFTEEERDAFTAELLKQREDRAKEKAKHQKAKDKGKEEEAEVEAEEGQEAAEEGVVKVGGVDIQRYKGLGEMNAEQLWETTMDPLTRTLKIVTVEDAQKADEVFDILMGSDVAPRKKFIQTNAKSVKNLDV